MGLITLQASEFNMADEQESFARESDISDIPLVLRDSVGFLLNDVARMLRASTAEALAPLGISPRHASIMFALSARRVYSQQALCELLGIDRTSMVAFINKLEAMELVSRKINAGDRRVYDVSLTDKGEGLIAQVDQIVRDAQRRFLHPLTEAETEQLGQILFKLREDFVHKG